AGLNIISREPTNDPLRVCGYLDQLAVADGESEMTFSNLVACIEEFTALRKSVGKTTLLVLVTDEAGDDPYQKIGDVNAVDVVAAKLKQNSMLFFVIGYAAPFGRESDLVEGTQKNISYGPESAFRERINLGLWDGSTNIFRYDSGFGPWNLERLCRESGGQFLPDRPAQRSMRLVSKMQSNWPAVTTEQFSSVVMSRYKPYYGPIEAYEQDLQSNKAKLALHAAAKLPHARTLRVQVYEFRQTNEAAMVRSINSTQRVPAVIQPGLEKLYNLLKSGEADREALVSKRWRASYDLAYGRTLANYVRVIGLNSMLAELKAGKTFSNPENNSWMLVPDDEVSTGTSSKKMAQKANVYLRRVIDEHPETPWALIAKKELESPFGWKWQETKR
ncbi:MAG: hypothetical protein VX438_00540, partial [Planctomycetota bacterium]|nr:hypothetical protein [Planctomycetota bacterium]